MLNYNNLKRFRCRVQKPDCWNKYADPVHNLLYAILLQAALDSDGYTDTSFKHQDGSDARNFLNEYGKDFFDYLKTKERFSE